MLRVSDNGIGLPVEMDFRENNTLGLQLVKSLVKQLDGTITSEVNHGTEHTITFKELMYKNRI